MSDSENATHESYPDVYHDVYSRTVFGFWLYLLTDFILFGTLFATYAVLQGSLYPGPTARDLFSPPFVLVQTLVLLVSSLTAGLGGAYAHRKNKNQTILYFAITFFLGIIFMWMELSEMVRLVKMGYGWEKTGFLSSYFTLIGTHGVHMVFAILWTIVFLVPLFYEKISFVSIRRLTCLKMFWQFLNVVWVFIFSFIYLMGAK